MGIERHGILKHKWYLYMTEFFAGMSVMAVELGASRLLAPYFSSSQIVWTIIIGTIMIAMALGNVWGGRNADKDPNPEKLYIRMIVAALWIAAIPLLGKYIIIFVAGALVMTINSQFLVVAAFISCMLIFVFPLFLLGTVTPSLAKYTMDSLEDNGKTVGMLGAFNTIGSIIGTFAPTFLTIPAVGTSITFLIFSGVLLLLALVYFISCRSSLVYCGVSVVLFFICTFFGASGSFAFWENDLAYEGESVYNYLQVKEDENQVVLATNVLFGVQSVMNKNDSLTGMYYDYALAAPLMVADKASGEDKEILVLGMGTGTFAKQCRKYLADTDVEGVEIDSRITALSQEYFDFPEDIKVTTYDGRAFLQATDKKYDVIMIDAYQDITIPFQFSSKEFFELVRKHLSKDGVMVVNMNMYSDDEGGINQYLADTISTVFEQVYTVDVKGSTNRELFASSNPELAEVLRLNSVQLQSAPIKKLMQTVAVEMTPHAKGNHILTDDRAPVELLGMKVIDSLISEEIGYYKDIYREDGLQGLLKEIR